MRSTKLQTRRNGKEGLNLFKEHHTDLIVTDMVMPEKDGLETIREAREENPDVKIIAISGGGGEAPENYLGMAKSLGANVTFSKPVDRTELLTAARKLLA